MPELKDVLQEDRTLQWMRPGIRLEPKPSADAPERVLFLCNDGARHFLAWKDGDGVVHQIISVPK